MKSSVPEVAAAYGRTKVRVPKIGRYSEKPTDGSDPITPSIRSSDPDPSTSNARYRAAICTRKSLDVRFSRLKPSIMKGGAYVLGLAWISRPSFPGGPIISQTTV